MYQKVMSIPSFIRLQKDPDSDGSSSGARLSPPSKRIRRHTDTVSSDNSPNLRSKVQGEEWNIHTRQSRLSGGAGASLQNGHGSLSRTSHPRRGEGSGDADHSHINGVLEVGRSRPSKRNRFDTLNQSMLFDRLVNSTAEAVLQEMDNISSIRQNREVERLRMWTDTELENMDMYSRVKRRRKSLRRSTSGIQPHHEVMSEAEGDEGGTEESHDEEEDDEEGDEAEEAEEENDRPYNLRQRKTVQRYQAPPIEPASRKQRQNTLFDTHRSPARRSHIRVKKHAIHSSDTTSSSDEERFEIRKSKSMTRARNRCLPMNLRPEHLASGVLRDRVKVGASLADVDPMSVDSSVRFDSVGGLAHHIQALKEMVVFPLLYPEVFERFKIQPPRGCLFYGPPGTGKTLVARALANECSQGDRKVAFFMRKGADCLSKWVGESERQLRLLFDQAYLMRPSIIFFDEIDGLAPVRSSRQDQIHSSIVSTLLALMDGLDNRGEIVIIGATNRLDSIDPALRRPGRFDREFLFNLPDKKARKHVLQIHTRDWNPKLADAFLVELAEKCVGYCGADIKALCTEAALVALRRRYPQIYASSQKLQLDVSSIVLGPQDFYYAMRSIVPASQRAMVPPGKALSSVIRPLLQSTFSGILATLHKVFPHAELSLGDKKEGYCGADIKALCTEAALVALRRRYPQIYASSQKLQLDVSSIVLGPQDFYYAMRSIVPASQRAMVPPGKALSSVIRPLLQSTFSGILATLHKVFPHAELSLGDKKEDIISELLEDDIYIDDDNDGAPSIFDAHSHSGSPKKQQPSATAHKPFLHFTMSAYRQPTSYRPRLLVAGDRGSGQSTHLAPAILHSLEKFSMHRLDLPTLYSVSAKTPEESCAQVFREARRTVPSVVYMPQISEWWEAISDTVRTTFLTLLQDIPSFSPVLILATSEIAYRELSEEVKCIFRKRYGEVVSLKRPSEDDRRSFFEDLIVVQAARPPVQRKKAALLSLEVLAPAVPPPPRQLSEEEQKRLEDQEETTLRELRLFLRDVTKRLANDKRFNIFAKPVDVEEVSDYLEVIKQPMDLSKIMTKIDTHKYFTGMEFLADIDLISGNALEYNPDKDPGDKIIRHRACTLKDTAHAMFAAELDPEFNRMCDEIKESRNKRGFQMTAEPTDPFGSVSRRMGTGGEEAARGTQGNGTEGCSNKCSNHIKRKVRRRPQWGRGIIRRKKHYLKKKGEEEEGELGGEDSELAEFGELDTSTDCLDDTVGEEPGDHSLSHDESSCDAIRMKQGLPAENGTVLQQNGHLPSMEEEEESANEPMLPSAKAENPAKETKLSEAPLVSSPVPPKGEDCRNGDESLDSLDSEASHKSAEDKEALTQGDTPQAGGPAGDGLTSHGLTSAPESQDQGKKGMSASTAEETTASQHTSESEMKEMGQEKEGVSKMKCHTTLSEQLKKINVEKSPEEPTEPTPPVIVNRQRLASLLQLVTKKSENYTVDQLERLFSLLSQCIYQHRRDYDKTHLAEDMERTVDTFETFL
ncbi:ATPase family AAA domain-containing protein 2B [Acipenser ruthenus]|uniref:ATPase family AAA domain-containing protein 2 n=1 Tax=Acipenser ruthenus TaxID=7906 RepID=A0A662YVV2_ACIRT|nr:ATPase family AAA domain-containing protein 2B [Acipenser ruthenus]